MRSRVIKDFNYRYSLSWVMQYILFMCDLRILKALKLLPKNFIVLLLYLQNVFETKDSHILKK